MITDDHIYIYIYIYIYILYNILYIYIYIYINVVPCVESIESYEPNESIPYIYIYKYARDEFKIYINKIFHMK